MTTAPGWQDVYDFWFPSFLDNPSPEQLAGRLGWWFTGGSSAELPNFAHLVEDARSGRLSHWLAEPYSRLSLILVLDQFARGLFAGTPEAFACDQEALRVAEEGVRIGHYADLPTPWQRGFFLMPLTHTEGPGHRERLERAVAMLDENFRNPPEHLRRIYEFAAGQTRDHLGVITRFGRFPHRNEILGRISTPEEVEYLRKGEFVHTRRPNLLS